MLYEYFIAVRWLHNPASKIADRSVDVGISTPDLKDASALYTMCIKEITDVLTELNSIVAGQLDYLDWGTDLFYVSTEGALSWYGDYDKAERTQVSTTDLIAFLTELKNFKEQCLAEDSYKTSIGKAFTAVKANPSQYQRWPTSDIHFLIVLNNITFTFALSNDDFNLTEAQFVDQLKETFK